MKNDKTLGMMALCNALFGMTKEVFTPNKATKVSDTNKKANKDKKKKRKQKQAIQRKQRNKRK